MEFKINDDVYSGMELFTIEEINDSVVTLKTDDIIKTCGRHNLYPKTPINKILTEFCIEYRDSIYNSKLINHREIRRFFESKWVILMENSNDNPKIEAIQLEIIDFTNFVKEEIIKFQSIEKNGIKIFSPYV